MLALEKPDTADEMQRKGAAAQAFGLDPAPRRPG